MANTYTLIDKAILTGSQASVSFTGLDSYSSDYTDLLVRCSVRSDRNDGTLDTLVISFNSSISNLSYKGLYGNGSSAASNNESNGNVAYITTASSTSNTFSSSDIYIPNFSSSNYKSYSVDNVGEENGTTAYMSLRAGLWSNTAAITSITLSTVSPPAANLVSGCSFYLYGIKNS
jgi:hypothetical protein